MNENDKNIKKIGISTIFNKKIVERSSEGPGNYPKCLLRQRDLFCVNFRI